MNEEVVEQIVDEVFSSLEPLDTQGAALLAFLKAKGIASDEELAPFLRQAANTSSVRWLAARVRIKSLIASAMKDIEKKPVEAKAVESEADKKADKKKEEPKAFEGESPDGRAEGRSSMADAKGDGGKKSEDGQEKNEQNSKPTSGVRSEDARDAEGSEAERPAPAAEKTEDKNTDMQAKPDVNGKVA